MERIIMRLYLEVKTTWFVSRVGLEEVSKIEKRNKNGCKISVWKRQLGYDGISYDREGERVSRLRVETKT